MKKINARNPDRAGRIRVLILEDDLGLQAPLARTLQEIDRNIEIYWATTVEEAFTDIEESIKKGTRPYDLILADIYLTGPSTGIDLWRVCQNRIPETPFILTSSMAEEEFSELVAGCEVVPGFLSKPFYPATWKHVFEKYLGGTA